MNIAKTIYQHVKTMPMAKAIEVLHFVEFLKTRPDAIADYTITCGSGFSRDKRG